MTLKSFLKENAEIVPNQKVIISERFKDDDGNPVAFELKALSEKEIEGLRKACTKRIKTRNGYKDETDQNQLVSKMIVESVVFPPLKSEQLQASYQVMGAEDLLQAMLVAGEYANLTLKVQEISGFSQDLEETIEDAKN